MKLSKVGRGEQDPRDFLARISRDRTSSASQLLLQLIRSLRGIAAGLGTLPVDRRQEEVRRIAQNVRRAQPAMGAFQNLGWDLSRLADDVSLPRKWVPRFRACLARWEREIARERTALVRAAARGFPAGQTLLCMSRSQTLLEFLGALPPARRPRAIHVLESRPGGEGRDFARDLKKLGMRVRVFRDDDLGAAFEGVTLVLLGADAVLPDGSLVHKVGTRRVAGAAYRRAVPTWVVTGSSKCLRPGVRLPSPLPPLFDRTPAKWVTLVWRERGRAKPMIPVPHDGE